MSIYSETKIMGAFEKEEISQVKIYHGFLRFKFDIFNLSNLYLILAVFDSLWAKAIKNTCQRESCSPILMFRSACHFRSCS